MKILHDANEVFEYELLIDYSATCTGCLWQTAIMRDNVDRFGGFFSLNAMWQGLNKFLWPCVYITMYNEIEQVCVGC